jgi:hypothetical protein
MDFFSFDLYKLLKSVNNNIKQTKNTYKKMNEIIYYIIRKIIEDIKINNDNILVSLNHENINEIIKFYIKEDIEYIDNIYDKISFKKVYFIISEYLNEDINIKSIILISYFIEYICLKIYKSAENNIRIKNKYIIRERDIDKAIEKDENIRFLIGYI